MVANTSKFFIFFYILNYMCVIHNKNRKIYKNKNYLLLCYLLLPVYRKD